MVKKKVVSEIIEKVLGEFSGKCAPLTSIIEHLRKAGVEASYSTIKMALDVVTKDGRAEKYKLHGAYTVYCFGRVPEPQAVFNTEDVERCIEKLGPSTTFSKIAQCVLGRKPRGNATGMHLVILYALLKMVRERKIMSFTVFANAEGRPRVVIMK